MPPVIVVGGGLAGVACARRLQDAGQPVLILERGHRLGGRMSARTERIAGELAGSAAGQRHSVDLGAPYFTVRDPGFADVVAGWQRAGRARKWTDTFAVSGPSGPTGVSTGPQRWAAALGLRDLIEALAEGLDVRLEHEVRRVESGDSLMVDGLMVDGEPAAAVVLAMPDPQAARLVPLELGRALGVLDRAWSPVLSVSAAWPRRCWPEFDGMFVADSEVLSWVADSGRSHGDGAPVLVAHSTAAFAERFLDDGPAAVVPILAELPLVLGLPGGLPAPDWARAHRWRFASAEDTHSEPFVLTEQLVGVCGDGWGPQSRVEQAWTSGNGLAEVLLNRLAVP
jgi:renalase